jgi:hypothetical protein
MFKLIKKPISLQAQTNKVIEQVCEHPAWFVISEDIDEFGSLAEARCLICGKIEMKNDADFIYKLDETKNFYNSNYIRLSELNNFKNLDEETIYKVVKLEYFNWLRENKEIASNSIGFFKEYKKR